MLGLLCRFFIDRASPEPERPENPVKIFKRGDRHQRIPEAQSRTNRSIENPCRSHDRHTGITLQGNVLPIPALTRQKYPDIRPKVGMPSIMDPRYLPDMGRMNGNWPSDGKIGCSRAPIAVLRSSLTQ